MTRRGTVHNELSQAERRKVMRDASCYSDHSHDDAGGRWQKQNPTMTVGADPAVQYPQLPSDSYWAGNPVGLERPLGFSVDQMEPTGEFYEVAASLRQAGVNSEPSTDAPFGGAAPSASPPCRPLSRPRRSKRGKR